MAPTCGFWGFLAPDDRAALTRAAHTRHYTAREALCSQGEPAHNVLVIRRGWAKVAAVTRNGGEAVLAVRGPNDIIGESGMLRGRPRCAGVYALSEIDTLVIGATWLWNYLTTHPDANFALAKAADERRDLADRRAVSRANGGGAPGRLAGLLVELMTLYPNPHPGGAIEIGPPLSQTELAAWTGDSRETIARVLGRWRTSGILTTERRRIVITNPAALTGLAECDK